MKETSKAHELQKVVANLSVEEKVRHFIQEVPNEVLEAYDSLYTKEVEEIREWCKDNQAKIDQFHEELRTRKAQAKEL